MYLHYHVTVASVEDMLKKVVRHIHISSSIEKSVFISGKDENEKSKNYFCKGFRHCTKNKVFIKDFFNKWDQIHRLLRI